MVQLTRVSKCYCRGLKLGTCVEDEDEAKNGGEHAEEAQAEEKEETKLLEATGLDANQDL